MSDQFAMATRMINASICAYNIFKNGVEPPAGPPVSRKVTSAAADSFYQVVPTYQDAVGFIQPAANYTPEFMASGDDRTDAVLIGQTDDRNVVVAIRGTIPPSFKNNDLREWLTDWANDADVLRRSWDPAGSHYGCVERGFGDATEILWPWIKDALLPLLADEPETVLVTGHSKGGAMTYLVASLIRETWPELDGKIEVHAFAPAVAVDEVFEKEYAAKGLAAKTTRYQVQNDIVPFLPYWKEANVWGEISFSGWWQKLTWAVARCALSRATGGGYTAPGGFEYFNCAHAWVPGAKVETSALTAVAATLNAEDFRVIADAHSAADSYLPCFSKLTAADLG
jgi:hypothetical protein